MSPAVDFTAVTPVSSCSNDVTSHEDRTFTDGSDSATSRSTGSSEYWDTNCCDSSGIDPSLHCAASFRASSGEGYRRCRIGSAAMLLVTYTAIGQRLCKTAARNRL